MQAHRTCPVALEPVVGLLLIGRRMDQFRKLIRMQKYAAYDDAEQNSDARKCQSTNRVHELTDAFWANDNGPSPHSCSPAQRDDYPSSSQPDNSSTTVSHVFLKPNLI